jgi:tetratricopeptide (TPR) repeat protein
MRLTHIIMACALAAITNCASVHAAPTKTLGDEGHELVLQCRCLQAITLLSQHLQQCPNDTRALIDRANAYRSTGQFTKAATDINLAIGQDPSSSDAYKERSALAITLGRQQLSKRDAIKALQLDKATTGDARYWRIKAVTLNTANRKQESIAAYKKAQQLCSNDGSLTDLIDQCLINRNLGDGKKALTFIDEAIKKYPDISHLRYLRGGVNLDLARWTSMQEDLDSLIPMYSNHPGLIWGQGYIKYANKDYVGAIADFDKAVYFAPNMAHSYEVRGHCHEFQNQLSLALKDYSTNLYLNPDNFICLERRAFVLNKLKQTNESERDCERMMAIAPKNSKAFYNSGYIYRANKQYDKSIQAFDKAIKLYPKNEFYWCARGNAKMRAGKYEDSIADCTQSLKLDSKRTHPRYSRGISYGKLKQYDLAIKDLSEAIDMYPEYGAAYFQRAQIYKAMGKQDDADRDMQSAIKYKYKKSDDMQ